MGAAGGAGAGAGWFYPLAKQSVRCGSCGAHRCPGDGRLRFAVGLVPVLSVG